ncbi:AfsR/SARP family transcriptional regulator [Sagittula sp. S175]|uniref:AfsR/SARP family transcriptional regulator n=1 Tax=Sagittula sp. S175 TaxID=3415129 RepID=UPI003C7C6555
MNDTSLSVISAFNAALFDAGGGTFPVEALAALPDAARVVVVSDRSGFLRGVRAALRLSPAEIALDQERFSAEAVSAALRRWAGEGPTRLLLDMRWVSRLPQGAEGIARWGEVAQSLSAQEVSVVSCYDGTMLIDAQVPVAFRAHRQFLAPSGLYENPYWMPPEQRRAPVGEQMSWLLGRIVPDYEGQGVFARDDRFAAHGGAPDWLGQAQSVSTEAGGESWQICCLGQLRVYRGGERVDWKLKGGAPKKTRTLFAYLLTKGETGAHSDRLAELLWPGEGDEEGKRARLHHTVAMLRKTLGDPKSILRTGDFYRLNAPEGSWVDITSFEQLCRRGMSLSRRGQRKEALEVYHTAEQLYTGDLFQDLPVGYVEDEQEDWCLPQRVWLREMALKLHSQMSALWREEGRLRRALEHCQKALAMDPLSDDAHAETLRVYHAQGRMDAMARQYRAYKTALAQIDSSVEGTEIQALYLALTRR